MDPAAHVRIRDGAVMAGRGAVNDVQAQFPCRPVAGCACDACLNSVYRWRTALSPNGPATLLTTRPSWSAIASNVTLIGSPLTMAPR
jgi:hypothetical protein